MRQSLTLSQSLWTTLGVALWVTACIAGVTAYPVDSIIKPTIWIFSSAMLLMLLMIRLFGGRIKSTLGLHSTSLFWGLMAVAIGMIYWQLDHWAMLHLFHINVVEAIQPWRFANQTYLPITVLFSSIVMAPLFEELLFRGLLFSAFAKTFSWLWSAILTALVFALIHWSWPEFISLFLVGMIYAWITHQSRSVIPAIIAHMMHNLITAWQYTHY